MKERMKLVEKIQIAKDKREDEILKKIYELFEEEIDGHYQIREAYPNSTKFIDIRIDALEEFRDKVKYEFRNKGK